MSSSDVAREVMVGETWWRAITLVLGTVPILGATWVMARHVRFLKREKTAPRTPSGAGTVNQGNGVVIHGNLNAHQFVKVREPEPGPDASRSAASRKRARPGSHWAAEYEAEADRLDYLLGHGADMQDAVLLYLRHGLARTSGEGAASLRRGEIAPVPDLPTEELAALAEAGHGSIDRALAELMIRLGPPPRPSARSLQPTGAGDGGVQS
ncbi:hypothetical protein ACIF84_30960 [Streptomyces albidoflavus]